MRDTVSAREFVREPPSVSVRVALDGRERREMGLPPYHHYHMSGRGWGRALRLGPVTVEVMWSTGEPR